MSKKIVDLHSFEEHLNGGRKALGLKSYLSAADLRGRWTDYSADYCAACCDSLEGGEHHFQELPFSAKDMRGDEARGKTLDKAEEALLSMLSDVRGEKAELKLRQLERADTVYTSLDCRVRDPLTKEPTRSALRTLLAGPERILRGTHSARATKRKATVARTESLLSENARLQQENQQLRQGTAAAPATSLQAPAPAPAAARRRSRR